MWHWVVCSALLTLWLSVPAGAAVVAGVEFADRVRVGETELELHSTGLLRYRVVFKGYVAALYREVSVGSAGEAPDFAAEDQPRRLEIEYFWPIPADVVAQATVDGIRRNTDPPTFLALRERVDRINRLYEDVEAGDRYALTYVPGVGTELSLNGRRLGVVEGADFASALFAIWLGDRPLDESLREQLLDRG